MTFSRFFSFVSAMSLITTLTLNVVLVPGSALAAVTDLTPSATATESVRRETPTLPVPDTDLSRTTGLDQKSLNNALFLLQIQQDLKAAYKEYKDLSSTIDQSQTKISMIRDTVGTLREQIISFQHEIDLGEEKIRNVAAQIGLKEKELTLLEEEVRNRGIALEGQKKLLADYMRLLYIKEHRFSADDERSSEVFSSAKLILADDNVGDTLHDMRTLDMLQHSGQIMLESLSTSQAQIIEMEALILQKKQRLDDLKDRLLAERQNLQDEQQAKAKLLEVTRGEQQTYEKLIAESQKQEDESILQINALQSNFNYIKANLGRLGNSVQGTDLQKILDDRTREIYEFQQQQDSGSLFQWPIKPARGVSAFFRDSSYRARFGVAHQAIDIPTNQATKIHAPKDGIVYKTKDNGLGYSYIILSHKDKLMTVYGHVSSILVKEGQIVKGGDVIGLTGGMPGTKGAGYMTTGPHLHFEVLKNGEHVDPLDYLSLTRLPLDSLPEKYSRRVEEQRAQEAQERLEGDSTEAAGVGVGVNGKSAEQIDRSVERSGQDEIEVYRRLFGIPKDL